MTSVLAGKPRKRGSDGGIAQHEAHMAHALRGAALTLVLGALGAWLAGDAWMLGASLGAGCGLAAMLLEHWLARATREAVLGGVAGLAIALALAALARLALGPALTAASAPLVILLATLALAALGAAVGARRGSWLSTSRPEAEARPSAAQAAHVAAARGPAKLMDTSVVIDGRIVDIITAGFVEGVIVVPQFVLKELQQVADSSDPLKRNRGRKGLDTLRLMQESPRVRIEFTADDTTDVRDVDAKLLWLADRRGAKILTNDYNLNKVAQLRGIEVLNVNDLANAVKPVVLPGEALTVQVIKEGKERNQGVGYLDDGTMVVVENGKRLIGQKLDLTVTSVIQTNAGKMIFAQPVGDEPEPRPRVVRRISDATPPPASIASMPQVPHVGES